MVLARGRFVPPCPQQGSEIVPTNRGRVGASGPLLRHLLVRWVAGIHAGVIM
ncbi:MAG: hypothetical protein H0U76_30425 [Ktedonobacteraceae bacterium]|nr:hypothetical protein [Ktedonobacteraceae bacterium]